jgi:hypothetical protein
MEPIYRIQRPESGTARVERVDQLRLLSPTEREEARRRREEKRREVERKSEREPRRNSFQNPPQEPQRGTDYYG